MMKYSPLTAAALGLKIGLLVCVFGGCDDGRQPTPATDAEIEAGTHAQGRDLASEIDELTRNGDAATKTIVQLSNDLSSATERIKKLESADHSCPLPEVGKGDIESLQKQIDALKPKSKAAPKKTAAKSRVDDAIDKAKDDGRNLLIVCRQTNCIWCDRLESNVLNQNVFATAIAGVYEVLPVNIDNDQAAEKRFEITRTPLIVVYDTADQTYHVIEPDTTVNGVLGQLGIAPVSPPRKGLLGLKR